MSRLVRKKEVEGCNYFMCNADRCDYYECIGCEYFDIMLSKLYHYENLEEQGRLIELPCKVGSCVYFIGTDKKGKYEILDTKLEDLNCCVELGKGIGKWLYLTKEEAEAKLAELKEGGNHEES